LEKRPPFLFIGLNMICHPDTEQREVEGPYDRKRRLCRREVKQIP
jgi:hypothetical protein